METREYGSAGPVVVVIHGGPGAPGELAPLARELASEHRVIEPLQRRSGGPSPLTVATHVSDLIELLEPITKAEETPPVLLGSSWGAMLALATAAARPDLAGPIVLVGCGTFDVHARAKFRRALDERVDDALRLRLADIAAEVEDPDRRLGLMGAALIPAYVVEPDPAIDPHADVTAFDARGFQETWDDMLRLQRDGTYPAAFAAISSPVLMLHGSWDPHPGEMIRRSLEPHIADLEYREIEGCGHYPWLERRARVEFYGALRDWVARR